MPDAKTPILCTYPFEDFFFFFACMHACVLICLHREPPLAAKWLPGIRVMTSFLVCLVEDVMPASTFLFSFTVLRKDHQLKKNFQGIYIAITQSQSFGINMPERMDASSSQSWIVGIQKVGPVSTVSHNLAIKRDIKSARRPNRNSSQIYLFGKVWRGSSHLCPRHSGTFNIHLECAKPAIAK
jgi:hypothetical protein